MPLLVDGTHLRTLKRALEIAVTKERLAAARHVTMDDLDAYLAGAKPLPAPVFLAALDIVAT